TNLDHNTKCLQFRNDMVVLLAENSFNVDKDFIKDYVNSDRDKDKDLMVEKCDVYFG
ncbi:16904_t:CDS:1, partial [Dentiscutata erythropus]